MRKYSDTIKQVLQGIAIGGGIALALSSGYFWTRLFLKVMQDRGYIKREIDSIKLARAVKRLEKSRLIILHENEGKFIVELTEKGKRKLKEIEYDDLTIQKPSQWDRKWRVVIFDIPENRETRARDALREKLREWNFYRLQKSVYVCPWPCENEILFLCAFFNIAPFVNILTTDHIYNDISLRKYFHLL